MKRNFLLALLGIVAMLTSCNKEDVGSLATNKTTSFNVSADGGVKTRAEVTDLTRYVMEVYRGTTATGTPEIHKEQANGKFMDVLLNDKQEYTVLFWADYGTPSADGTHNVANEYNAADLKAAKIALQPTNAAYSGVSKFTVGTSDKATYTNVELTHAVAQVNFVQTDKLTSATNTLVVNYPESYSVNVGDNAVTKIDGVITHNFTYNNAAAGTLGTSYLIAAKGTPKTVLEITATLNSETAKVVSNVPFERNFRTNISGAYSSKYETMLKVTCDDVWGTPENETVFPKAEVGNFYYKDKTFSSTYTANAQNPCIGIVFAVNADCNTGKIVSLDEATSTKWSTETVATGATSDTDGAANTAKVLALGTYSAIVYPAFGWCATKNATATEGIKWYIPAKLELKDGIYANKATLNASLALVSGAAQLSTAIYWSSMELGGGNDAWLVNFFSGGMGSDGKSYGYSVRVVSAF